MDIATSRKNRPKGRFFEKGFFCICATIRTRQEIQCLVTNCEFVLLLLLQQHSVCSDLKCYPNRKHFTLIYSVRLVTFLCLHNYA